MPRWYLTTLLQLDSTTVTLSDWCNDDTDFIKRRRRQKAGDVKTYWDDVSSCWECVKIKTMHRSTTTEEIINTATKIHRRHRCQISVSVSVCVCGPVSTNTAQLHAWLITFVSLTKLSKVDEVSLSFACKDSYHWMTWDGLLGNSAESPFTAATSPATYKHRP